MITMHPGAYLRNMLLSGNTSARDLARKAGISKSTMGLILAEKRNISAKIAVGLEKPTGRSAESWMAMQTEWSIAKERKARKLGNG